MKHTIKIIIIFLISGNLFSQSIPTLKFRKPTTLDNTTWKFASVATGVDAFITVIGSKNASLDAIDDSTAYAYAWQPFIKITRRTNSTDSSYVHFRIEFKKANGTPQIMSKLAMTVIDLDGSGSSSSYREMVSSSLPVTPKGILGSLLSTYTNSTNLTMISGTTTYSRTDTNNAEGMAQLNYSNISSYTFKVGVVGAVLSNSTVRQFSFYYKAFSSMVSVLPVKMVDFKVVSNNEVPVVSWTTTMEENSKSFEVYRSLDGINYTLVSTVKAKGNSQSFSNYSFADNNLYGQAIQNVFYKLKVTDLNGAFIWSSILHFSQVVESSNTSIASVYPNPSKGIVNVNFSSISENDFSLELLDMYGNVHHSLTNNDVNGLYSVSIDFSHLANGVYYVKLNENGLSTTTKVIKN
jgi:hypothetical protein